MVHQCGLVDHPSSPSHHPLSAASAHWQQCGLMIRLLYVRLGLSLPWSPSRPFAPSTPVGPLGPRAPLAPALPALPWRWWHTGEWVESCVVKVVNEHKGAGVHTVVAPQMFSLFSRKNRQRFDPFGSSECLPPAVYNCLAAMPLSWMCTWFVSKACKPSL